MEEFEYGFFESKETKVGKISLRSAIELITKYNENPKINTKESLAVKYKLTPKLVGGYFNFIFYLIISILKNL